MSIIIKTIGDLKEYRFFVPSYQRGYRWTKQEVTELLDDVKEFSIEGNKQYCIQPLIVKRRADGSYEVVDGQQRLTTIFIFMKIASQEIRSAIPPFEIEYKTRLDSADFLKSLSDDAVLDETKNIDFYHIANAYKCMNEWLNNQPDKSVAIQELNTKIRKNVIFIWYEMPEASDPIAMFTKVNLGKIPLTNAELIKALLFNKDNFPENSENITKRQAEMSVAWDRIEQGLREDSFWCFFNKPEQSGTRIDVLFELLAKDYNNKRELDILANQNYFSFSVFFTALKSESDKEQFVSQLWGEVEKLYSELRDWYTDLDKYHIIGYLIAAGVKLDEIFTITRGKRKSDVTKDLLVRARKTIPGNLDKDTLLKYQHGYNNERIRNLLLLFNIATLVRKSERQNRFPFDIYKKGSWDIEHIHAKADDTGESDDSLWNLALLDYRINRSPEYAAETFDEKRRIIIEREARGLFIPLCTINVFLKVYSSDLKNMEEWGDNDKADYIAAIEKILKSFFEEIF